MISYKNVYVIVYNDFIVKPIRAKLFSYQSKENI